MKPRDGGIENWVGPLLTAIKDPADHASREEFIHVSKMILRYNAAGDRQKGSSMFGYYGSDRYSDGILGDVAKGLFEIGDLESFEIAINQYRKDVPPAIFPYIAKLLVTRDLPSVKKM